ncbi:MAG: DUF4065 domain-containing protein [bacterium]|nr:DUF4065 domain-containing protein [bacterium]
MIYDVLDVSRYIINYSNSKEEGISNLKLQKILYFVQAYFLIKKKNICFNDRIEAWGFGPVIPKAYHEYKQFGGGNIPKIKFYFIVSDDIWDIEKKKYNDEIISKPDKKLINDVVNKFENYTATQLVELTHHQTPWIEAYEKGCDTEITIDSIKEYFNVKK